MPLDKSKKLYETAKDLMPGGVNSPARSWSAVGGDPIFVARGHGPLVWDVDGNCYIDYLCSWGPMILGHAHSRVVDTVKSTVEHGTSFGAPTEHENDLACLVLDAFPTIDLVRFVSSGTEATMSALRLARAFTGKNKIVKFEGGYHGHADALLVSAGSGAITHGVPNSAGVTSSYAKDTLVADYNDIESVKNIFQLNPDQIAAVIVEPVAANMGVIPPVPGFLEGLRTLTSANGALLVFDEVVTGFRVAYGGAQHIYGVDPDITCLGKILGGGFPVGAYGGRKDIMEFLSPIGPTYQAGTLSGNPIAMVAGKATLQVLQATGIYDRLESASLRLSNGLQGVFSSAGIGLTINRVGSMMTTFFTGENVTDWKSVSNSDKLAYSNFFRSMLGHGVYLPPSPYEAMFVSVSHTDKDIDETIDASKRYVTQ